MTRVLRLYPAAWRDRYGDEMADLLAENPPSLGDLVDLARGAIDAHLHRSMIPAAAGSGGSVPLPSDLPATRRRIPVGAFLGTLSAGLFLVTAAIAQLQRTLPLEWAEVASMLLAFASIALGLALLATTGRAVIAKLAGLVFLSGVVFLFWTGTYLPTSQAIVVGSVLLALGSAIENRPSRTIGAGTAGLALALWTSYHADLEMLPIVIAGYGFVALGVALSAAPSWRPVLVGAGVMAIVASVIWAGAGIISQTTYHDGYGIACNGTDTRVCVGRIDLMAERMHSVRPNDVVTRATVNPDGSAEICAAITVLPGETNPFDKDAAWMERMTTGTSLGIQLGGVTGDQQRGPYEACWND